MEDDKKQTLNQNKPPKLRSYFDGVSSDDTSKDAPWAVTDTMSLRSSILNYKWEYGRRYHAFQSGTYWAPNDERQQEAEDLVHEMYRLVLGGRLTSVPLDNVENVLDVGCGNGVWAIEFAEENPSTQVMGVDLSPIQPSLVPPNCKFEIDNVNDDWIYSEPFDLIHVRAMTGCVPDWVEFYRKALSHLKPGAWIEQIELSSFAQSDDNSLPEDSAQKRLAQEAGFTNIQERRLKIPIGSWPKDATLKHWGAWNRQFLLQGLEGFSLKGLTDTLEWKYEDAQLYLAGLRKELMDVKLHSYIELLVLTAQKPI
ncbi:unnamed protein product [Parascedosporium putredinis]|uniref:S-adenosyl-L-methionine-dependent methyltransferase n=1 Tax=Parascedosporium putredinis TaxID=1442378 RepID=A0A9P1HBZ7_9PEZI|nr:unnamed protein product [Parascedosporium putredinis]CAI8004250.1 unnamed protein product [Parascedosporium putredinis]